MTWSRGRRRLLQALGALAGAALGCPAHAAPEALSARALGKLVDRARPALLRVAAPRAGTAVLVGVGGELLAPAALSSNGALRTVDSAGREREAKLVARLADVGLALFALEPGSYPAAPVGSALSLKPGSALVGLYFDRRGAVAASAGHFDRLRGRPGGPARLRTDVDGPLGTALFNARGELVAVHAGPPLATVPIDEIRARLSAPRPP